MNSDTARERLRAIGRSLDEHPEDSQRYTVRQFIGWFGFERRTRLQVRVIRRLLREERLKTEPDFNDVHIDSSVQFQLLDSATADDEKSTAQQARTTSSIPQESADPAHAESLQERADFDRAIRINRIPSANREVISVKPDAPLKKAVTLMMSNDYSQLPVMQSSWEVKGMVSWESIGKRLALGRAVKSARDCMESVKRVSAETRLFDAVDDIIAGQAVLVLGSDNSVVGIVTTADLSREFEKLGNPFLRIGEIEQGLRVRVDATLSEVDIANAVDPKSEKEVASAADLTLGEMTRMLEQEDTWEKLGLGLDRKSFVEDLHRVARVRNEVMHFDPEGLEDDDLEFLQRIAKMLHDLSEM